MSAPIIASLGRVTVAVSGATTLAAAVAHDLDAPGPAAPLDAVPAAFELVFPSGNGALPGIPIAGVRMLRASFVAGAVPQIQVRSALPGAQARLPDPLYRFVHPAHLSRAAYAAQLAGYQLIDGMAQVANLAAGQSFLHASGVQQGDRRVAVVARGGMGKTGSLLELVGSGAWQYLSDDWTVIDDAGVIARSHKPLQVFPRNLTHLPDGVAMLLAGRSAGDRFAWNLRTRLGKAKGMRRKVTATELFGADRVGTAGPLTETVLVRRTDVDAITERSVSVDEVAREAAAIVADELAPSLALLEPHLEELSDGAFTSIDEVHAATAGVVATALADAPAIEVAVPRELPEPAIERHLVERFSDGR